MQEKTRIIVDADSCPKQARTFLEKTAIRLNIALEYAANHNIPFFSQSPLFTMTLCANTEGAADDYIVESVRPNDLVVTRDIPLAQRLVHKGITVINDRGTIFTLQNVSEMLEERELKLQMQELGVTPKNTWHSYGKKESSAFAITLDKVLSKLTK